MGLWDTLELIEGGEDLLLLLLLGVVGEVSVGLLGGLRGLGVVLLLLGLVVGGHGCGDLWVLTTDAGEIILTELIVDMVVSLGLSAGDGDLLNASHGLLIEEGVGRTEEGVLHNSVLTVSQVDGITDVEDFAVVGNISVVTETSVGAREGDINVSLDDLIGRG